MASLVSSVPGALEHLFVPGPSAIVLHPSDLLCVAREGVVADRVWPPLGGQTSLLKASATPLFDRANFALCYAVGLFTAWCGCGVNSSFVTRSRIEFR